MKKMLLVLSALMIGLGIAFVGAVEAATLQEQIRAKKLRDTTTGGESKRVSAREEITASDQAVAADAEAAKHGKTAEEQKAKAAGHGKTAEEQKAKAAVHTKEAAVHGASLAKLKDVGAQLDIKAKAMKTEVAQAQNDNQAITDSMDKAAATIDPTIKDEWGKAVKASKKITKILSILGPAIDELVTNTNAVKTKTEGLHDTAQGNAAAAEAEAGKETAAQKAAEEAAGHATSAQATAAEKKAAAQKKKEEAAEAMKKKSTLAPEKVGQEATLNQAKNAAKLKDAIEKLEGEIAALQVKLPDLKKKSRSIKADEKAAATKALSDLNAQIEAKQKELEGNQAELDRMTAAGAAE